MTKSRVFFFLLIAFVAGVTAASFLPLGPGVVWAVFVSGSALIAFSISDGTSRAIAAWGGACFVVAAFGMFWTARALEAELPFEHVLGSTMTLTGIAAEEPRESARSQHVVLRDDATGTRVLVFVPKFPKYRYGDRVRIEGVLEHPENFTEEFDYRAYLAKDDIYYVMSFPEASVLEHGRGNPIFGLLFSIKNAFGRSIERILPEPHAAFLKGLLLGERQSFSEELRAELRATGTTHLVALSGYNITIVGDNLLRLLRFLWVPFTPSFWLAGTGIVGFVLLTGAQASVVRAAIMGILVLIARREGRQYRMQNAIAFAACLMLLENPKLLRFDVAFQLSFLATLGLIYGSPLVDTWYERMRTRLFLFFRDAGFWHERRGERSKGRGLIRETLVTTLGAQLFVAPLLVYSFGNISLVSPLANLFVLPAIPFTMFSGFVAASIGLAATTPGWILGWVAHLFLSYELKIIHAFASVPYAVIENRAVGIAFVGILYGALGFWSWRRRTRARNTVRP